MAQNDSVDKIIGTYFRVFCDEAFTYKGKRYEPKQVRVGPTLARGLTCNPNCAGCCPRFSLDYIPGEELPYEMPTRDVFVNGIGYMVYSDKQSPGWHCKHVKFDDHGFCGIHGKHPFSCDFEIIRAKIFMAESATNQVLTAPFGRAWQLLRVDGVRGALCEVNPANQEYANEAARKLQRLAMWMEYFEVPHKIEPVVKYLTEGQWAGGAQIVL